MLKIAYSPVYKYTLPEGHRFPMEKYDLVPSQLLYEGTVTNDAFFHPKALSVENILRTHDKDYWYKLKTQTLSPKEIRNIGFPMTAELIHRGRHISQGTIDCCNYAIKYGVSMNIAGGTHHSFKERGEGFCIFNDFAIASNYLLDTKIVSQILVVDLDVHQGNGTAKIFENDDRVFTFSMHGEKNYPTKKEKSNLDIGLPDKTGDKVYLDNLMETLPHLIQIVEPDLILYLSGVDVLESDKLGRLGLSIQGSKERDRFVFDQCKLNNIPVAVSMGGGYSPKIADIVEAHSNTYRLAQEIWF